MSFLLSRLAREVKVVPTNSHEANSWAANSAGLLAWRPRACGLPTRLALSTTNEEGPCRTVARARVAPPYSRAAATVSHRLPERGVCGWLSMSARRGQHRTASLRPWQKISADWNTLSLR